MAKQTLSESANPLTSILQSATTRPTVYDVKEFTNRVFTLTNIEWQQYEARQGAHGMPNVKVKLHGVEKSTGKNITVETSQIGICEQAEAIEASGAYGYDVMIVKEGKYNTLVAR